mmetsp:Transcript_47734/g.153656  ORF Transcript_47734/g.153656 Transcript_47734/m.153656 type:complete len:233 (+) Transcript_47734:1507-2205(+)
MRRDMDFPPVHGWRGRMLCAAGCLGPADWHVRSRGLRTSLPHVLVEPNALHVLRGQHALLDRRQVLCERCGRRPLAGASDQFKGRRDRVANAVRCSVACRCRLGCLVGETTNGRKEAEVQARVQGCGPDKGACMQPARRRHGQFDQLDACRHCRFGHHGVADCRAYLPHRLLVRRFLYHRCAADFEHRQGNLGVCMPDLLRGGPLPARGGSRLPHGGLLVDRGHGQRRGPKN